MGGRVIVVVVLVVAGGMVATIYLVRRLAPTARESIQVIVPPAPVDAATPVVAPVVTKRGEKTVFQATVNPFEQTTVYARAQGYLRDYKVDIGSRVTKGDVLAEISTPELDQDILAESALLVQARASLEKAKALRSYAKITFKRFQGLEGAGLATQQDYDQKKAEFAIDEALVSEAGASVGAQEAKVARLKDVKAFARVTAPFTGIVMARYVSPGTLVVSTGKGTQLFDVIAVDNVRVVTQIPQEFALRIHDGLAAETRVSEYPTSVFIGEITRTAGALDPRTHTLTTEIVLPNADGRLMTGMSAEVSIALPPAP